MKKFISSRLKSWLLRLNYLIRSNPIITYPAISPPKSSRFRGALGLRKHPDGQESCVGCKLCEASCPTMAIRVVSELDVATNQYRAKEYEIDFFKCIYCGLCEAACPVDALVHTNLDDYHFKHRGEQIFNKQKLLAIGVCYEPQAKINKEEDAAFY